MAPPAKSVAQTGLSGNNIADGKQTTGVKRIVEGMWGLLVVWWRLRGCPSLWRIRLGYRAVWARRSTSSTVAMLQG